MGFFDKLVGSGALSGQPGGKAAGDAIAQRQIAEAENNWRAVQREADALRDNARALRGDTAERARETNSNKEPGGNFRDAIRDFRGSQSDSQPSWEGPQTRTERSQVENRTLNTNIANSYARLEQNRLLRSREIAADLAPSTDNYIEARDRFERDKQSLNTGWQRFKNNAAAAGNDVGDFFLHLFHLDESHLKTATKEELDRKAHPEPVGWDFIHNFQNRARIRQPIPPINGNNPAPGGK